MKQLKILIPIHVMPERTTFITILLNNIIPILKEKVNVQMIWFVFQAEKEKITENDPNNIILQNVDFDNAIEVIEKFKPDLIYNTPTYDLINFPFNIVAKKYNIPSFFHWLGDTWSVRSPRDFSTRTKSYVTSFFESSLPTDTKDSEKKFMKRGLFFLKKYTFLYKTQRALGWKISEIVSMFFVILRSLYNSNFNKKFNPTVVFVENEIQKKELVSNGYLETGLEVVGHPLFDVALKKFQNNKPVIKNKQKIKVLFLPSTLVEHNFWNKTERDNQYKQILEILDKNEDNISVTIKIHPTTARIEEYNNLVKPFNNNIPIIQKGNVLDLLDEFDVIISERFSSAEMYAIIARKPIIMCNFGSLPYDLLLEKKLAIECKNSEQLVEKIHESLKNNSKYEEIREKFLKESIFKLDGNTSERIASSLLKIANKGK